MRWISANDGTVYYRESTLAVAQESMAGLKRLLLIYRPQGGMASNWLSVEIFIIHKQRNAGAKRLDFLAHAGDLGLFFAQ